MDRLRAGCPRGGDDLVADQIAFARRGMADMHRLVGLADVQRIGVGIRIDRNGPHTHLTRGPDDAASDFAAIGDEERGDHCAGHPVVRFDQVMLAIFHRPLSRIRSK